MKKIIFIGLTIIMFFFKSPVTANYEKVFFDLKIEGITGESINFNDFKKFELTYYFRYYSQKN